MRLVMNGALDARLSKDFKMSENSVDSTVDDREEEEEEEQEDRNAKSSRIARRLKTLFCCLKRESHTKEIVEFDPDDYDYIIEKLVVKRVPLALFAIPTDLLDRRKADTPETSDGASQSTSLSAFSGNGSTTNAITRAIISNKALRFNRSKNQDSIGKSMEGQTKSSIWREEILNKFSALHPDLKQSEKSPKDSLNFPRSRRSFADISEAASSTRTEVSSKTTSSVIVQNDIPIRDNSARRGSANPLFRFGSKRNNKSKAEKNKTAQEVSSEKNRDKFIPGWNRRYIVSPFRIQKGSFDLAKPKSVAGDFGVDGKSLAYIEKILEDKSSELTEDSKDHDSHAAVRWRITFRHQRANMDSERVTSEV